MVTVTYESWLLIPGSAFSDLNGKILVVLKSGRLQEVVAQGASTILLGS